VQLNNFKEAEDTVCADRHISGVSDYFVAGLCRILDVSFNRLREIKGLDHLHKLQKLFLCANKISRIENVGHLKNLTLLELGDNKIRASGSHFPPPPPLLLRQMNPGCVRSSRTMMLFYS